jgi:hypothetical protein
MLKQSRPGCVLADSVTGGQRVAEDEKRSVLLRGAGGGMDAADDHEGREKYENAE